jgi:hypothetical protein
MSSFNPGLRHVDVAILYGQGQKDRAHAIAKKLRPVKLGIPQTSVEIEADDNPAGPTSVAGWRIERPE